MITSETIGKIAEALSKAQGMMTGAKKANNNPFFKSKYSDLSHVMEAISEPFAANDLSFIQSPGFDGDKVTVTTRIMHKSGEWLEGTTVLPPTKNDAQGYGSAITYAKRYGLQAMAGVPSVDDDGNEAVKQKVETKPKAVPNDESRFGSPEDHTPEKTEDQKQREKYILDSIRKKKTLKGLAELWQDLSVEERKAFSEEKNKRKSELEDKEAA